MNILMFILNVFTWLSGKIHWSVKRKTIIHLREIDTRCTNIYPVMIIRSLPVKCHQRMLSNWIDRATVLREKCVVASCLWVRFRRVFFFQDKTAEQSLIYMSSRFEFKNLFILITFCFLTNHIQIDEYSKEQHSLWKMLRFVVIFQ